MANASDLPKNTRVRVGPNRPRKTPNKDSMNEWLASFEVGERRYVETTADRLHNDLPMLLPYKGRRPAVMAGMEFTRTTMTACSHTSVTTVLLICVERVK